MLAIGTKWLCNHYPRWLHLSPAQAPLNLSHKMIKTSSTYSKATFFKKTVKPVCKSVLLGEDSSVTIIRTGKCPAAYLPQSVVFHIHSSVSIDLSNCRSKVFSKKSRKFQKQNMKLPLCLSPMCMASTLYLQLFTQYLHCVRCKHLERI